MSRYTLTNKISSSPISRLCIEFPIVCAPGYHSRKGKLTIGLVNITDYQFANLLDFFDSNHLTVQYNLVICDNSGKCVRNFNMRDYQVEYERDLELELEQERKMNFRPNSKMLHQFCEQSKRFDFTNQEQIDEFIEYICKVVCGLDEHVNFIDTLDCYELK